MSFRNTFFKTTLALLLSACATTIATAKDFTIVIDPGHGGHDHGAIGAVTNEKSINLGVALELGKILSKQMKDAKVVYTRNTDVFVPLQSRADIANRAGGDIFISIHTNSVDKKSKNRTTVSGASVYTLGFKRSRENLEVAMRENAVMKLEDDYSATYQGFDPNSTESYIIFEMGQNKHMEQSVKAAGEVQRQLVGMAGRKDKGVRQANFWVLFKTAMPSMLVELDFICNPTQEKFLASKDGQTKLAKAIYQGIKNYRKEPSAESKDRTTDKNEPKRPEPTPQAKPQNTVDNGTDSQTEVFKIQFLATSATLPDKSPKFKGLWPVESYIENGTVRYTYGRYRTMKSAMPDLAKVRTMFPDAFIVTMKGNRRIK